MFDPDPTEPVKLFPADVVGRVVHEADECFYTKLPPFEERSGREWRFCARLQIKSYWFPDVAVVLHCFYWERKIERRGSGVRRWEDQPPTDPQYNQVMDASHVLLKQEFGGERLDYAFIHHFSRDLNTLGNAVRRAVKAYEAMLQRGREALDVEVLAGAVRLVTDDDKAN